MKKKLEMVKSVILSLLIITSLLLTLAIWNYQPNIDEADNQLTDAKLNGKEETKKNLIQPSQIIFHNNDFYQGLANKNKQKELYTNIQEWSFYDFDTVPAESLDSVLNQTQNKIEIIFPTPLPFTIIRDLFTVNEEGNLPESLFDRMYILLDEVLTSKQVQFVNNSTGSAVTANIQNIAEVRDYMERIKANNELNEYITYTANNESTIYLPTKVNMYQRPVQVNLTSPNLLRSVLFNNPSTVRNSKNITGEDVYTDGFRTMVVYPYHIEYTNPTSVENNMINAKQLINQTFQFIHSHQGWTTDGNNTYQLYDLDRDSSTVQYRLTYDGFPVFVNNEYSTITVTMGEDKVPYHYNRPLIQLKSSFTGQKVDDLHSAEEIIAHINQENSYPADMIENIAIGYKITEQQGYIFELTPAWFIKSYLGWRELVFKDPLSEGGG